MLFLRLPWSEVVPPHLRWYSLSQNPFHLLLRIYPQLWSDFPCCSFPLRCKFQRDRLSALLFHQNISKIQQSAGHIIGTCKDYWIEKVSLIWISDHVFFIFYLPQNISLQIVGIIHTFLGGSHWLPSESFANCITFSKSALLISLPISYNLFLP